MSDIAIKMIYEPSQEVWTVTADVGGRPSVDGSGPTPEAALWMTLLSAMRCWADGTPP